MIDMYVANVVNLSNVEVTFAKAQGRKHFRKLSIPCHDGIHQFLSKYFLLVVLHIFKCKNYFDGHSPGRALRYRGGPHLRYVFRGRRGLF